VKVRKLFVLNCSLFLFSLQVSARVIQGTLLNDDSPYFIRGDDGNIYKAEWYWGSTLFSEGDDVILTDSYGSEKMIDDTTDETADVWVEEISPGYPRRIPRYLPTPNFTPSLPAPSYPTPAPTPTPAPMATPIPARQYKNAKWPDGRMLIHPEHFVKAPVINVAPDDKLELRRAPRETSPAVAEIPFDSTDITAFDMDPRLDGDTWWFPVEWHGYRGYVAGKYISISQ
jgi:hypothetical protein